MLFDQLDDSYRRAFPESLGTDGAIGAFRRNTSGIRADVRTMTIVTCVDIDRQNLQPEKKCDTWPKIDYSFNEKYFKESTFSRNEAGKLFLLLKKIDMESFLAFCAEEHQAESANQILPSSPLKTWEIKCKNRETMPYLALLDFARLKLPEAPKQMTEEEKKKEVMDARLQLVNLASNVRKNSKKINDDKSQLARFGLTFRAWVLELEEHLFTWYGQETFEAVLTKQFLKLLATRMWELSTGILGGVTFSYETLAAKVRERDIWRVKLGVNRLAVVTRHKKTEGEKKRGAVIKHSCTHAPIRCHASGWHWFLGDKEDNENENDSAANKHPMNEHCLEWVYKRIDALADPQKDILKGEKNV